MVLRAESRHAEAVQAYEQALARDPEEVFARKNLTNMLMDVGEWSDDALSKVIGDDAIDILFDLAGSPNHSIASGFAADLEIQRLRRAGDCRALARAVRRARSPS